MKLEKFGLGSIAIICLTAIIVSGHYFGINGMTTATCIGIIGAVLGTLLGFEFGLKKGGKNNEL